jgi:hypothetical protein
VVGGRKVRDLKVRAPEPRDATRNPSDSSTYHGSRDVDRLNEHPSLIGRAPVMAHEVTPDALGATGLDTFTCQSSSNFRSHPGMRVETEAEGVT